MFRFDWDDDSRAVAELAREFGRSAAAAEREAAEGGAVPQALRKQAEELGLFDLSRSQDQGGLGLSALSVGHAVTALVAEAPTIATSLLLPEAGAAFGAPLSGFFADGGAGALGYRRPAGVTLEHGRVTGRVAFTAASPEPGEGWVVAASAAGDRLCRVAPDGRELSEVPAMGLTAMRRVAATFDGAVQEESDFGAKERAQLFLAYAPFFHGYGRAALHYARGYAAERKAFGKTIGGFQAIGFLLADVAMEVEAAELLWQESAWRAAQGEDVFRFAADALRTAKDAAYFAANSCIAVLGGHGFVDDHPAERWLRDVETLSALTGNRSALGQASEETAQGEEAHGVA
ncbi:MAG: acyl-CoA dehydrogenase [Thermaerobacter sp.]|nr:acyl-CoA dehydrogenase [Thermaerobacter sp.]